MDKFSLWLESGMEENFIEAILKNLSDPSLYLYYADWLEERGDALGEYIRSFFSYNDMFRKKTKGRSGMKKRVEELGERISSALVHWYDKSSGWPDRFVSTSAGAGPMIMYGYLPFGGRLHPNWIRPGSPYPPQTWFEFRAVAPGNNVGHNMTARDDYGWQPVSSDSVPFDVKKRLVVGLLNCKGSSIGARRQFFWDAYHRG